MNQIDEGESKQPGRRRPRRAPQRDVRVSIRSDRRDPADVLKLSRALISLALADADAEAKAQAEHQAILEGHPTPKEAA